FVGGATIPLLLSDTGAVPPRVTLDVDVVVDPGNRVEYNRLEERLRDAGYLHPAGGPICRWSIEGVPVDLMPAEIDILGFTNRWYGQLDISASRIEIAPGLSIRVANPALLLATQLEAYMNRGKGDYVMSHDITDVVTLVEGRAEIVEE